jgi:ribose-phosphate pyrophosphokinase
MNRIVVFSGNAHKELAAAICRRLKKRLSPAVISRFSNNCLGVQLEANCREADVFIVQPLVPPVQEHLMEMLLMLDAARGASAARITAVIPHYAYTFGQERRAAHLDCGAAGRRPARDGGANRLLTMTCSARARVLQRARRSRMRSRCWPSLRRAHADQHHCRLAGSGQREAGLSFRAHAEVAVAAGSKRRLSDDRVEIDSIVGDVDGRT